MRALILVVGCLLVVPSAQAQTNPCTTGPTNLQVNPTTIYVELVDWDRLDIDGQLAITDTWFSLYAEGADPNTSGPVQGPTTIPRTAFTLVMDQCYRADLPGTIPSSQRLIAALRYHRAVRDQMPEAFGPWAVSLNPFGSASGVLTLTPGAVRVVRP